MKRNAVLITAIVCAIVVAIATTVLQNNNKNTLDKGAKDFVAHDSIIESSSAEYVDESLSTVTASAESIDEFVEEHTTKEDINFDLDAAKAIATNLGVEGIDWEFPRNVTKDLVDYDGYVEDSAVIIEFVLNGAEIENATILDKTGDPAVDDVSQDTSNFTSEENQVYDFFTDNSNSQFFISTIDVIDGDYIPNIVEQYKTTYYYLVSYEDIQYAAIVIDGEVISEEF